MIVNKLSFSCCWLDGMRPFLLVVFFFNREGETREKRHFMASYKQLKKTNGENICNQATKKKAATLEWNELKRFWTDWNRRRRWWYKRGGERYAGYASLLFHWTKYHLISRFTSIRMREEAIGGGGGITTTTGDEQQTGGCVSWSNTTESWLKQRDTYSKGWGEGGLKRRRECDWFVIISAPH